MGRAKKRADRIRAEISIVKVLSDLGYHIHPDGGDREQQFPCDLHGDGSDSKPSARVYPSSNSWYCVSVDERVLTSDGWITLRDLGFYGFRDAVTGHERQALDGASNWSDVVAYIPKGRKEVLRIRTKAGYAVCVTPDHEIEVVGRGWVAAGDVRPGDVLVVPLPKQPRFGRDLPLAVQDLNDRDYGHHTRLNLPDQWSVDLGETLGYVFGDGWVVPRQAPASGVVGLTTHAEDLEDARAVFRHMQAWASGRGSEAHRTDISVVNGKAYTQNQYVFSIGNDGFVEFFCRLGLAKSDPPDQRRLPESIWQAPECGVRGFLRGVYGADGSAFQPTGRKGIKVNLYSVSGPFLRDVQLLLLQFGIHSRLYPPSKTRVESGKRKGKFTHPCWYLQLATGKDILTFRERIGIANRRKQAVLDSYVYNPRGAKPFKPVVESIKPVGIVAVADLSLPIEHSFVAGGIKVHNCFACGRTRDAIQTVREKEGLDFWKACDQLEQRYGLPPLPWDDEDVGPRERTLTEEVRHNLSSDRTFEEEKARLARLLMVVTEEREVPMRMVLAFWEAFDRVCYGIEKEGWSEARGKAAVLDIRARVLAQFGERTAE